MAFNGLRLEYALEGSYNYIAWKYMMEEVLEDNGLKEFIDNDVPKPVVTDVANLDAWKNKVAKAVTPFFGHLTYYHQMDPSTPCKTNLTLSKIVFTM